MNKKILITGASGLIGSRLTELLIKNGYQVNHLGRSKREGTVPSFVWNVDTGEMDEEALKGVTSIIHLAGAGVADKRWSVERKKEILESRLKSTDLLFNRLRTIDHSVDTVVSASAIGYYGFGLNEAIFKEESKPATDFLAHVTELWESKVDQIGALNIRVAKIRIGIVLSTHGGALATMALPVKLGLGSPIGTGKQYLSWIHVDDLCSMFIKALEDNEMKGAYNGVIDWCNNMDFEKTLARVLKRPLWFPAVPSFVLRLAVGEMAEIVLNGSKVSSEKIRKTGFTAAFPTLEVALKDLLVKPKH